MMNNLNPNERKFLDTTVGRALLARLSERFEDIESSLRQGDRLWSVIATMSDGIEHGSEDMVCARLAIASYIDRSDEPPLAALGLLMKAGPSAPLLQGS